MRTRTTILISALITSVHTLSVAQPPESFFPHHVGDLWQYRFYAGGTLAWTEQLDSMFVDSSGVEFYRYKRVYHDNPPYTQVGWYAIPESVRVFETSRPPTPIGSWKLFYKLDAQVGEVWLVDSGGPRVAQLIDTGTTQIFGRQVSYIDIQYGYLNDFPDTVWWDVRSLARGFGLIYAQLEPMGPVGLAGAIIDSVRYGLIVNVPEPIELPRSYILRQNFPNPFNPTTTVEFELPEAAIVSIRVYDVLGQQVATLTEGRRSAGIHRLVWDARQTAGGLASELPSGVYFIRLNTPLGTQVKKAILMR